jgi:hypothetical protein
VSDPKGSDGSSGADEETVDLGIPGIEGAVEIGLGGFGRVYRAGQPAFGRTVAVKVLSVGKLDDKAQQRFERECQAMGALSGHPNIVTVFDAGTTVDGRPFLIMEFMSGGSYDDKVRRNGTLSWEEAAEVGAKVSAALQVAHDAGIIHRDIKPANVLISRFDEPQLGDFGIARITGGSETKSGVITASMAHAAPEVLDGARPTAAADVYAVGSMVYELLTGVPAFFSESDETNLAMIKRIYDDPVPDLRAQGVPDSIARVVEGAMAKKVDARPMTAAQLAEQFREALRQAGDTAAADAAEAAAATGVAVAAAAGIETVDPSATTAIPPTGPVAAPPPGAPGSPSTTGPTPPPGAPPATGPVPGYAPPPPTGPVAAPPGMPPGARPFTTDAPHAPSAGKKNGALVPLLVGGGVLALLVVIVVAVLVLASGGDDGPGPTTSQQAGSTETSETSAPSVDELPEADSPGSFDDESFDALADTCQGGDLVACDVLFTATPVDSDAETYGSTCGGRNEAVRGACSTEYEWALPDAQEPGDLGDDTTFDDLVDDCQAGDLEACDELYAETPVDSSYEAYGRTCGGRLPAIAADDVPSGQCVERYGDATA